MSMSFICKHVPLIGIIKHKFRTHYKCVALMNPVSYAFILIEGLRFV